MLQTTIVIEGTRATIKRGDSEVVLCYDTDNDVYVCNGRKVAEYRLDPKPDWYYGDVALQDCLGINANMMNEGQIEHIMLQAVYAILHYESML